MNTLVEIATYKKPPRAKIPKSKISISDALEQSEAKYLEDRVCSVNKKNEATDQDKVRILCHG